jgi:hypothetical protein
MGGNLYNEMINAGMENRQAHIDAGKTRGKSVWAAIRNQNSGRGQTESAFKDKENKLKSLKAIYQIKANDALSNYDIDGFKKFSLEAEKAQGALNSLRDSYADWKMSLTAKDEKKQIKNRESALARLREMAKKGKISWYDYAKAQKAVQDSTGKTTDIMGEALLATDRYRGITNKLAQDMTNAKVPMEQQKAIMKKLRDAVAEGRLSLKKYQEIVKNSKGDVTKLNKEIAKIPKTKTTKHTVTSNVASIKKQIKSITKKIKTEIELTITVVNKGSTKGQIVSQGKLGHLINDQELNYARQNKQLKVNKDGSIVIQKGSQYATDKWLKKFRAAKIKYTIKKFASGGYLEDGLFTMNRGEIAGRFDNGKSVVANNYQISEGIAKSLTSTLAPQIYAAVKQGMNDASGNGSQDINVYLDGKQLAENSVKYIRQMNRSNGRTQFA